MVDNRIPDSSLSASSTYHEYKASRGRLNKFAASGGRGGWIALDTTYPWFEVDFGSNLTISQVATQGHSLFDDRVKTYSILIRRNDGSFMLYNNNKVSSRLCFYK